MASELHLTRTPDGGISVASVKWLPLALAAVLAAWIWPGPAVPVSAKTAVSAKHLKRKSRPSVLRAAKHPHRKNAPKPARSKKHPARMTASAARAAAVGSAAFIPAPPEAAPVFTPTAVPSATARPTRTATPAPTRTATRPPTRTRTPTPTATRTPILWEESPTPERTNPYLPNGIHKRTWSQKK